MLDADDRRMLQEAAAGFISEAAPVSRLRSMRDDGRTHDAELWAQFAEMGWAGVIVPEAENGAGMGLTAAGIIAQEAGRTLAASPFLQTAVVAATGLVRFGTDEQRAAHLAPLVAGKQTFALAVDEARRHAPARTAMTARSDGNGFVLSGKKVFVADGSDADTLIVAARSSGAAGETEGLTLFLVDASASGVSRTATPMVDSRGAADVSFDEVRVDGDAVLGTVDHGWEALSAMLDAGRAVLSAEMVGGAQQSLSSTLDYLAQRKQFGVPLSAFQALQHRAADLHTRLLIAEAAVFSALESLDAGADDAGLKVAVAKAKASEVFLAAGQEGVQMHGGMGMTDAFDIGFYLKRAKVSAALFGDANFHGDALARHLGY